MMDHKRSSIHIDARCITTTTTSSLASKRHKPMSADIAKENKKDKFGERIAALQQLVSPYGKTDTASVLLEAMEYIQFLHEQLKVLSAPYLQTRQLMKMQIQNSVDMRSRGLCLVPVSSAVGVASSGNGADIWAPINSSSSRY